MKRRAPILRKAGCAAILLLALTKVSVAAADATVVRSLEGYGADHSTCREWSDGCAVCRRDDSGQARCSTPGIACQAGETVCRESKP